MTLREYLNGLTTEQQAAFAERCGTSIGYLRKAMSAGQILGVPLCVLIERESSFSVTRKELRDDYLQCWPELERAA